MKLFIRALIVAAIILLCVSPSLAQTVTGTLSGHVADTSGAVMPGIKVVARNQQTQAVREAITNAQGFYEMSFMPLGTYDVVVSAQGFQTVKKTGLLIELNSTTVSDFALNPSTVSETISVTGEVPMIESTQGEVKFGLEAKQVEDTPLAGRNFMSLVEQIPGFQAAAWTENGVNNPTNSAGSYASFNGTGSRSATFQIDGVNNDDSSENQNRQNVNVSSIAQFQVLTNAFSAQFGRAGGAVVLVQTKSGTNSFHGDAYDFIQNDILNANGFFQNAGGAPRQIVRRNQYGGTVGGPVFKDKLFFFASAERIRNVSSGTMSRFAWLPSDKPHACAAGEVSKPGGPYCLDPAVHPNMQRDLAWMNKIMDLWNTPELQGKTPNDPGACADLIASGRPNRCVRVSGLVGTRPVSDYAGKFDYVAPRNTNIALRYQYSRQIVQDPRIIKGDNYGTNNNRQYNLGLTATHVFSPRQTGEFRYGFGNRTTLQDVVDDDSIPTIRFSATLVNPALSSDTLPFGGTVIGTSTSVPINRRQHDNQFVYNHTLVSGKHTLRAGIDQRFSLLDDLSGDRSRGYWTFGTNESTASIRAMTGYTGWENFLRGYITGYQQGFGNPIAENRFSESNLYFLDDLRIRRNLILNLGVRWEGVGAPREIHDRFSYGYSGDYNNVEPRFGFAYTPSWDTGFLRKLTGGSGQFVIRGGYGIYHSRLFQSIFSQNQLSIRTQPPNGYAASFGGNCPNEISDPTCGFVFTPGVAARTTTATGGGVTVQGGQLQSTLLIPDKGLHLPYTQQWNFTIERQLPKRMAIEITYNGNRTIGGIFYDGINQAMFPIVSPNAFVDVGGGNLQRIVFDRACTDYSDPICVNTDASGNTVPTTSGPSKSFSSLTSTTATLAQKGIVIVNGVPHGYISSSTTQTNVRRADPTYIRNLALRNFGWGYYHGLVTRFTKRMSHGLYFTGTWVFSKSIDTGSEATSTGAGGDTNAPAGKGNAARSLRGLSSFDARHRFVLSYGYELPFYRSQQGLIGRLAGGWSIAGITTFQSGNPFMVLTGYDMNLDGVGNDRPFITDTSLLYRSVDNGRQISPCPTKGTVVCPDTLSQLQLPGGSFFPPNAASITGLARVILPGTDGSGSIGRNTFFGAGMNNFDMTINKAVTLRERFKLNLRLELYNAFNRVQFGVPDNTILSSAILGRIELQRNPFNYTNSARSYGSRMGQVALRLTF